MTQTGEFREYYVVFTDTAELGYPWRWFTRKGFRHCEVYMGIDNKSFSVCHTHCNVEFTFYDFDIHKAVHLLLEQGDKVVYVPTLRKYRKLFRMGLFIPSCISTCQKITGLSFNAFTPYGYYKSLLKNGGVEVGVSEHERVKTEET